MGSGSKMMMGALVGVLVFLVTTPLVASSTSATVKAAVCPTSGSHTAINGTTSVTATSATAPIAYGEGTSFTASGTKTSYNPGALCGVDAATAAADPAGTGNAWSTAQAAKIIPATTAGAVLRYAFSGASSLMDIVPLLWVAGGLAIAGMVGYSGYKRQFA